MKDQPSIALDFSVEDYGEQQPQHTIFQRIARAWLRFSGPNPDAFDASLKSQEILRRSHIVSVLHILIIIAAGIFLPAIFLSPNLVSPYAAILILGLASFLCNRFGLVTLGAVIFVFGVDIAVVILLGTLPHGLRNSNIPDFDLFLVATLAGGVILPRRLLLPLALFHIALIVLLFTFVPHEQLLTQEMIASGQGSYGEINDAVLLQIIGASIAWLNAWSVDRALLRVSKAEELEKAHLRLNEYSQMQETQRKNLEHGIQVLKEAHARLANGDYRARALLQENELGSLALSFNLLAERMNRVAQIALEYSRLEQAFQQLFAVRDALIHRGMAYPFDATGTPVDQVYPWMKLYYQARQLFAQYGESVERVRTALVRQGMLLNQVRSTLDMTRARAEETAAGNRTLFPVLEDLEHIQTFCLQAAEQGKRCLLETQQLEQMLKAPG